MTMLHSARLRLEPLTEQHYEGLQVMNRLPEVMRFISGEPEAPQRTREMIAVVQQRWATLGFSWWAFIERSSGALVGAGCVQYLGRDAANPLELGWRLTPSVWGQGLATEAAQTMADWAFTSLAAPCVVAICDPDNSASQRVMARLGMQLRGRETWHEQPHLVFQLTREAWLARAGATQ